MTGWGKGPRRSLSFGVVVDVGFCLFAVFDDYWFVGKVGLSTGNGVTRFVKSRKPELKRVV